ncbi:BlaI/MecI/CopY family transcriptional regulator [Propioniciclava flava]|uniref:CopY family transcriptional regulator n=1 Tax=Propioniciclava flava TaxID=2072026 RepID=A0A4Q2EEG2_9ACTN|nr:BlaI/MecI/CopY family transcriptional regulator [Propioniciclava flava]RXW31601.1 CopY family transcriptional regulator [Propioniciclava flava]
MPILGDLEHAVMDVLWARKAPTPVRDVHDELAQHREIAYTTVMTVLDRLAKKGVVLRRLDGRAWLYEPARSRLDLYVATVEEALASLEPQERTQVLRTLLDGALAASTK